MLEDALLKLSKKEPKIYNFGNLYQYKCGDFIVTGSKEDIEKFAEDVDKELQKEYAETKFPLYSDTGRYPVELLTEPEVDTKITNGTY